MQNARLIMYHKQSTSAKTLFLNINGTVCAFEGLPPLAQLIENTKDIPQVLVHPAQLIVEAEKQLGMSAGSLVIDTEFQAYVDVPSAPLSIFLARFTATDPPRAAVEPYHAKFISIMEARGLPPTELELLRKAYSAIMEG
ncbi:hypothetical protein BegalDRAFT_1029 [Beggiatoa alba B18LD]|uniref:Uncharacterized protein n=1 Tax=Beggiatoa alba B18LD TaxID=395493 RepID=I3CE89_9GAMM|nr:hypothetical protein [Beggiatoa alba]EIJ41932.1 hypothetical protein BegalDRAFT_1029 [Beggiatoa alba B18LD]